MSEKKGRLSYCMHCKEMTETVLTEARPLLLWAETRRTCIKCGEPKIKSRIEQ